MNKVTHTLPSFILLILLCGCYPGEPYVPDFPIEKIEGYRPVYATPGEQSILFIDPQPLVNPGKIYSIGNYLLINEKLHGIHVFNNSNPANPVALGFLQMAGNTEMAIRGHVLYADHLTDLVALDVEDWHDIKELSRLRQEHWDQTVPPGQGRYFECIDPDRGVVIGWELTTLHYPKCFR